MTQAMAQAVIQEQRRPLHLCFGGTFDPVHNGHLRVLLEVTHHLQAERVRLLPCHIPPLKEQPESSTAQRLDMLRLALRDQPDWVIDERELARDKPSYTIDTLSDLRRDLGPDVAIAWLVGMDAFACLDQWHRWRELGQRAHIIVVGRPGSAMPSAGPVAEWAESRLATPERLRDAAAGLVVHLAVTQQDIASSQLRAAVRAGLTPRYLVPDAVAAYIDNHKLYSSVGRAI